MVNPIMLKNGHVLDPQHEMIYAREDIFMEGGKIVESSKQINGDVHEIDLEGKVVIPGGIYMSFRSPLYLQAPGGRINSENMSRFICQSGFTSVVIEGLTPFTALDNHWFLNNFPLVNKIPMIDVANFQFILNFLKNGVLNYAKEAISILLDKFGGYGLSCLVPGVFSRWKQEVVTGDYLTRQMPLLRIPPDKIISELLNLQIQNKFKPGLFLELGIEGTKGSRTALEEFIGKITSTIDGSTGHPLIFKQISRLAQDPSLYPATVGDNIRGLQELLEKNPAISGMIDLPTIDDGGVFMDFHPSPLLDLDGLIGRGIVESELFYSYYRVKNQDKKKLIKEYWLHGQKFLVSRPVSLKNRFAFSIMPMVLDKGSRLNSPICNLLSSEFRLEHAKLNGGDDLLSRTKDILQDDVLSLEDFVHITRAVPANFMGLEHYLGGLKSGQIADAIVVDFTPEEWDEIHVNPKIIVEKMQSPHIIFKQGEIIYKNGEFCASKPGITFTRSIPPNASIRKTVQGNLEKQFLKFYSTHLTSKELPDGLLGETINMQEQDI